MPDTLPLNMQFSQYLSFNKVLFVILDRLVKRLHRSEQKLARKRINILATQLLCIKIILIHVTPAVILLLLSKPSRLKLLFNFLPKTPVSKFVAEIHPLGYPHSAPQA